MLVGVLLRSFLALQRVELSVQPGADVADRILPPNAVYKTDAQRLAFYDAILARTAALPSIKQAALASVLPLSGDSDTDFQIEGRPAPTRSADAFITWYRRRPWRELLRDDGDSAEDPRAAVRDREAEPTMRHVDGQTVLAQRGRDRAAHAASAMSRAPWMTIVGVVADVQVRGARGRSIMVLAQPGSGDKRDPENGW